MAMATSMVHGCKVWLRALIDVLSKTDRIHHLSCDFLKAFCRWLCERRSHERGGCCVDIPITEYKRPDPMLYSQSFLMKQGLAVTWNNPDIQLYDNGVPIDSSQLKADQDYEVRIRVWNNSYDAPAANLPVYLYALGFGVGNQQNAIGMAYVDLGVKGSSKCPAFASVVWHTPKESGHYCLQAKLDWPDDANPDNNVGQENTNVGVMHSPAKFEFIVRNEATITRRFQLETDMYDLPKKPICSAVPTTHKTTRQPLTRLKESRQRWLQTRATQAYGLFPVTDDWKVIIDDATFSLGAHAEQVVHVEIEYMKGTFNGRKPFNINAFASNPYEQKQLVGGVTLIVEGGS